MSEWMLNEALRIKDELLEALRAENAKLRAVMEASRAFSQEQGRPGFILPEVWWKLEDALKALGEGE
jgi:hypothetical protein